MGVKMSDLDLELIKFLHNNTGGFISGEEISNRLGVSRTTIWKHIKKLRGKGYIIESGTSKGYLLSKVPNRIIPEEIMISLNTKEIGKEILVFDSLSSTNDKAKELARNGCRTGTVVIAEEQTAGKGRLGRKWYSPAGSGLCLSIILLEPQIQPIKSPFLTITASIAVLKALTKIEKGLVTTDKPANNIEKIELGAKSSLKIKWPNDILISGKKVSGILSEMSADMDYIKYAVIGIGINVNQEFFPEEIEGIATSLKVEYQQAITRNKLLENVLESFEEYYNLLLIGREKELLELWKDNLAIIGEEVTIYSNDKVYYGRVQDISEQGELILLDDTKTIHKFWAGDVTLRKR